MKKYDLAMRQGPVPIHFEVPNYLPHAYQNLNISSPYAYSSPEVHEIPIPSPSPEPPATLLIKPEHGTPKAGKCPQCKGQKYSFTAYFHNTAIFSLPPHELLAFADYAYILKDRLKSLLITYAMHETDDGCLPRIEMDIKMWGQQVESLARDVEEFATGFEQVGIEVQGVVEWTQGMMRRLWEHVLGVRILEVPKGRTKELVLEFRKGWERVWLAWVREWEVECRRLDMQPRELAFERDVPSEI
jgi:hypothetical protein